MAAGFELYDAQGNLIVSITDRIGRFIGQIDVAANSSSSINVPDFSTGAPFYLAVNSDGASDEPYVTITGTTLQWSNPNSYSGTIYYGVY